MQASTRQKTSQETSSEYYLSLLSEQERVRANRVAAVRTVLVVLSSAGMTYDIDALRQKILQAYPDGVVFFMTTRGKYMGANAPDKLDLLIDFTGPRQRQGIFMAKKLRRRARVAVGRNAGFFRAGLYDRIFDEKKAKLPEGTLAREREVQRQVLSLAGVALVPTAESAPDRSQTIALELPPLQRS